MRVCMEIVFINVIVQESPATEVAHTPWSLELTHELSSFIQFPNMTNHPKSRLQKSEFPDGHATLRNRSINDLLENAADGGHRWSQTNCVERKKQSKSSNGECSNEHNMMNWNMVNLKNNDLLYKCFMQKKEIGTTTNHTMSSSSHVLPRFALDSRHSEGCFSVYTCWSAMHSKAVCLGLIFPNQTL